MENSKVGTFQQNPSITSPFIPPLPGVLEDNNSVALTDNNGDVLIDNGQGA
jgi:hypothetical protein